MTEKVTIRTIAIGIAILIVVAFAGFYAGRNTADVVEIDRGKLDLYERQIDSLTLIADSLALHVRVEYVDTAKAVIKERIVYIVETREQKIDTYEKMDTIGRVMDFRKWLSNGANFSDSTTRNNR